MFAFVAVVGFFFTFFSCKMLFSHICLLITVKLWKRLKKKKYFTLSDVSMHGLVKSFKVNSTQCNGIRKRNNIKVILSILFILTYIQGSYILLNFYAI